MKRAFAFFVLLSLISCIKLSKPWTFDRDEIESRCKQVLQLYPATLEYDILIVSSQGQVSAKHKDLYGKGIDEIAFYSHKGRLIVIQYGCEKNVIAHEIGHAIVSNYFMQPVPRWLHEELARKCESN